MEPTIDNTIKRIKSYIAAKGWSRNHLAAVSNIPEPTLRKLDRNLWKNPTAATLRKLEAIIPEDFTDCSGK